MPLMVASPEAIAACDDKALTIALAERAGVKTPRAQLARTPEEFRAAAAELGYPSLDVCMKPPQSQGLARLPRALGQRRPPPRAARGTPGPLPDVRRRGARGHRADDFPPLLVMELATGKEHTVDGICRRGRLVLGHAKTREAMRAGLAMYFETRRAARARGGRTAPRARAASSTGS